MHGYYSNNNYLLLDFFIFIFIFHNKNKFTNFKKTIRGQRLLYGTEVITIKVWEEILLLLRIKNQLSILIVKKITYVSKFLLNLILLICLEDKKYKWYYWSNKIYNKNTFWIIRSKFKQNNNYKIVNFKTSIKITLIMLVIRPWFWYIIKNNNKKKWKLASIIPTFLSMIVDKKTTCSYNQLHIIANSDIWHQKIEDIDLLRLYQLVKKYLKV